MQHEFAEVLISAAPPPNAGGDPFLRDFALVLIGALAGAVIGPLIFRFIGLPRRMKQTWRETDRSWLDHQKFYDRKERTLVRELSAIDEAMNGRGIFASGIHKKAREETLVTHLDELEDDYSRTIRRIEDAGGFPGWPEKLYFKIVGKRLDKRLSAEREMLKAVYAGKEIRLADERAKMRAAAERQKPETL